MKRGIWVCALILATTTSFASATDASPTAVVRVPGIYSDLAYNSESGDLLGTEIFIVVAPDDRKTRYVVFIQSWGEGGFDPVAVPAKVDGDSVSFIVAPPSVLAGEYKGQVTKSGFDGSYHLDNGYTSAIHLKRKKSYWE